MQPVSRDSVGGKALTITPTERYTRQNLSLGTCNILMLYVLDNQVSPGYAIHFLLHCACYIPECVRSKVQSSKKHVSKRIEEVHSTSRILYLRSLFYTDPEHSLSLGGEGGEGCFELYELKYSY